MYPAEEVEGGLGVRGGAAGAGLESASDITYGKPISTDLVVVATNLVIRDTRRHHAGVYVCRANKPKTREFVIAAAELHVLAPPVILQPPEAVSLSRGNTARFICNSSGEPPPALHWLRNGQPVRSFRRVKTQSPGVLLINQLAVEDTGFYQCIADNSVGTACATAKLTLTVIVREGLPSSPRRLLAVPYSSTTVLLTWERPEHNFDQVIGYSVHYQCVAVIWLYFEAVVFTTRKDRVLATSQALQKT
ncbi:hypothetical protein CRUP_006790 [Coryphaenoides rupestris]|nr:hypothetical protein CRUP_006790 [Coryphaenoides rupestris]